VGLCATAIGTARLEKKSSSHHSDSDIHDDEYIYWLYKQGRAHLYVGQTLNVQLLIEIEP